MNSKTRSFIKLLISIAILLFITPFVITECRAQDNIRKKYPLHTNPQSIAVSNVARTIEVFVLFSEIPPADQPATVYRASGEVFEIDRLGRESLVGTLAINSEINLYPSKKEAGLFGVLKIDARETKKLKIFAKLQAENNWTAVTQPVEINIFDEKEVSKKIEKMIQSSTDQFPDNEEMLKTDPRDYSGMRKACRQSKCCLASVGHMETINAFRSIQKDCPTGHQRNMFICKESIRWCEPVLQRGKMQ